jgi:NAD(P)-dependent dehydrogenase (short-subunit alcohol dehydrogenase family)
VRTFHGDLADLASVRAVAAELVAGVERIDVLVNNAGVAASKARTTVDGFDEMLEANYLGPFLLTHLLLDRIRASTPARIVVVGSEAHRVAGRFDAERFEDLGHYSGLTAQVAYGRTKLLDLLMADELARRLDGTGVTVNSLCPGLVATELTREAGPAARLAGVMSLTPLVRTPEQGARMTVRLASSASVEGVTGKFFSSTPGAGLLPTAGPRRDPAIARRVYERTCELLGVAPIT